MRGCRLTVPILLLCAFLVSCSDGFVTPDSKWEPSFGAVAGASGYFEFLSPVDRSSETLNPADFDPNVLSVVEVCRLTAAGGACTGPALVRFTRGTGIVVNTLDGFYQVNWKLNEPAELDPGAYRLSVWSGPSALPGSHRFGQIDFAVGANRTISFEEGDSYNPERTIPVKYRILKGALCETPDDSPTEPCFTGVVTNEGGEFINEAGEVALTFPPNSLPEGVEAVTLVIEKFEPSEDRQCLPTAFPQYENCYLIKTIPELTLELREDAVLEMCVDEVTFPFLDEIDLYKFDGTDPGTLVRVPRSDVLRGPGDRLLACHDPYDDGIVVGSGASAWKARLIDPVLAFFTPKPAFARRQRILSPTYDVRSFSRFGFVRPLELQIVEGDGLTAVVNNSVVPSPTVRVVAAGDEVKNDMPRVSVSGVPIHFTALGGATLSGTATTAVVLTDADGLASTPWTLGETPGEYTLEVAALNPEGDKWPNYRGTKDPRDGVGAVWGNQGNPDVGLAGFAFEGVTATFTATAVAVPDVAVHFLSPVEKGSGGSRTISEPLASIAICKVQQASCISVSGPPQSGLQLKNNFYQISWNTSGVARGQYRIRVLIDGQMPPDGFITVEAANNANSATPGLYWFRPGQNVEIKFGLSAP